ncbi:reticulocyte-binding protein homolog 2a-like isoform X4 [Dreissena polymorpha]|uniref:reticulocyte-binding protein homolog 2a-like isoform X4 n=1 Tax=Dreissena polymorpha TaxID=45954 RepID=UPI0022645CBD|nr:reticulocyte-binding protein homolog 2a-like isoform X4 [Dreissena polymorpha]
MTTQYQYSNCVGSVRFSFFPCTSCRETNIVEVAMCYCEKCQQCFCRECSRLHDQLFSKHIKYSQGEMKNWPVSKDLEDFLQICEKHTTESVSVFCKDHSQLCCYECVSLNSAKRHTAVVHELLIRLHINLVKLKNHQSCCESRVNELTISYQEYEHMVREINININSTLDIIERSTLKKTPKVERNMVKKMHQSIHSALDEIETSTLNEAKQTLSSLRADLKTGVDTYIKHYPELKLLQEALQYSSDKKNMKLCFIATRKSMGKLLEVESYLNQNYVKLEHSVFKQSMRDTENYFSKLSGLWAWVQSREAVTYTSNSDFVQYLFRLSTLGRNEIYVAGKYEHNAVDDKQLKPLGRTKNTYEVLVKENSKLQSDLTAAFSREMHEKSREDILKASKRNERLLANELDEVIQQKGAAEEELLTLKHNLRKCFTSEDKKRLQEQIARQQDRMVHLQDQHRAMKKRLCTLQEIVKILERRSTSTDESTNRSETEKLCKLIEEDAELKVESSLIKERLATDERVYYSTIGTMTDLPCMKTSDYEVNKVDQPSTNGCESSQPMRAQLLTVGRMSPYLEDIQQVLQERDSSIAEFQAKLDKAGTDQKQLQKIYNSKQQELEKLQREVGKRSQEQIKLNAENEQLQAQVKEFQNKEKNSTSSLDETIKWMRDKEIVISRLDAEISSKEQVQALQSLVKKGEDRMEIMKAELAKSALELKQAQNWIGTNKEQFIHVQDANLKLQSKVDASEEENNVLNKTVTSLQEKIQTQEREVAQLQTRMTQSEEAFRHMNKQHNRTLQERKEFEMLVHQLQAEADRQKEEYERLVEEARQTTDTSLAQLAANHEKYEADILTQHEEEKAVEHAANERERFSRYEAQLKRRPVR